MLCENCKTNTATVHVKGFAMGMKAELNLCQECSTNMAGMVNMNMPISLENLENMFGNMDSSISLENIFKGIMESVQSMGQGQVPVGQPTNIKLVRKASGPCDTCGLSYEQFKATGKLGCAGCYSSFPKEIIALFKNVQGSSRHEGKLPKRFGTQVRHQREVNKLRTALNLAVAAENYEDAARLRDQIRSMEVTP